MHRHAPFVVVIGDVLFAFAQGQRFSGRVLAIEWLMRGMLLEVTAKSHGLRNPAKTSSTIYMRKTFPRPRPQSAIFCEIDRVHH